MEKLISVDIKANFGFLRKPDTNDGIALSFNMLHRPAALGILGAIMGYNGFQKFGELPEYFQKLEKIKMAIVPLSSQNGNFQKSVITYTNTVGYGNKDGNWILHESTLINPSYRLFLFADDDRLFSYLKSQQAEFLPYLGKNEFPLFWSNFKEYRIKLFDFGYDYRIQSIFVKNDNISDKNRNETANNIFDLLNQPSKPFFYFERLPVGFQELTSQRGKEYQYSIESFAYTNATFRKDWRVEGLYEIDQGETIQLF